MERSEAYQLIDEEREYQNSKPPRPKSDADTSVGEWLIYIEEQLSRAKHNVYKLDQLLAMDNVLKIAALAVACMENNEVS